MRVCPSTTEKDKDRLGHGTTGVCRNGTGRIEAEKKKDYSGKLCGWLKKGWESLEF